MVLIAWLLVTLWSGLLLLSARSALRGLPGPSSGVEPYVLWLPAGGDAPELSPPPHAVSVGHLDPSGPERILVLRGCQVVDSTLPGRLAATGADFVSVFPRPSGSILSQGIERVRRDFAGVPQVLDPKHFAGFADERCVWLRRWHLELPGVGDEATLRAARALKAHGQRVDLRDGYAGEGPPWRTVVRGRSEAVSEFQNVWSQWTAPEPLARGIFVSFVWFSSVLPWILLLSPDSRTAAGLAILLGTAARLMTAVRDGFGLGLTFSGWAIDPFLAWKAVRAPAVRSNVRLPVLPAEPPPGLTASQIPAHATWLDHAGVPFLARRFGGAAVVMEQIYANEPCGDTRLGRFIDRQVHQSVAARAVRHRLIRTIQLARVAEPKTVLSVPCGSGRDVAAICSAQESVVSVTAVDPDPWALAATKKRCPTARVIKGGVDDVPNEAFDLILYLGLSEYLGDAEVIRHLKRLERALSPGGRIVTSLTAGHPQWGAMKKWLGWETRRRNPETFSTLVETAGLVLESREGDPAGAQWVMVLRGDRN